jgi:hypothetical protein
MPNYIFWTKHRETGVMIEEGEEEQADPDDVFLNTVTSRWRKLKKRRMQKIVSLKMTMLLVMLYDHKKLLYPSAEDGQKKLGTTLELLQWKAENGISDKAFGKLLKIQKKMLLKPNELPTTTYKAKKIVCPLGLQIEKNMHVLMTASCTVAFTRI